MVHHDFSLVVSLPNTPEMDWWTVESSPRKLIIDHESTSCGPLLIQKKWNSDFSRFQKKEEKILQKFSIQPNISMFIFLFSIISNKHEKFIFSILFLLYIIIMIFFVLFLWKFKCSNVSVIWKYRNKSIIEATEWMLNWLSIENNYMLLFSDWLMEGLKWIPRWVEWHECFTWLVWKRDLENRFRNLLIFKLRWRAMLSEPKIFIMVMTKLFFLKRIISAIKLVFHLFIKSLLINIIRYMIIFTNIFQCEQKKANPHIFHLYYSSIKIKKTACR